MPLLPSGHGHAYARSMERRELKRQIADTWDAAAGSYDDTPRHGIRYVDEFVAWRRLIAAILGDPDHAEVRPRRVLDIGTGTGVLALIAAELGHEVTAVDLSPGMLEVARRKAMSAGFEVDWRVADADTLAIDLHGFDVVMCRHLLWTMPDPDQAMRAWRDAARPGGLVAVIDGVAQPPPRLLRATIRVGRRAWSRLRSADATAGHDYPDEVYASLPLARQADSRAVQALMRGAGLERVRVRWLTEIDRVERAHQPVAARISDRWRHYLATGRTPILVADDTPAERA